MKSKTHTWNWYWIRYCERPWRKFSWPRKSAIIRMTEDPKKNKDNKTIKMSSPV